MHTTANCYSTECKTRGLPCRYAEMTGADFSFDAQNYCCKNFSCSPPSVGQGYQCFNGHSMENNGCREYKVCAFPIRVCHDLFFLFSLCGAIIIMIMLLCTKWKSRSLTSKQSVSLAKLCTRRRTGFSSLLTPQTLFAQT